MMSIVYVLWMYVILFAVIGWMRGWAKELMVSFSVVTALAVNYLLERYIPLVKNIPQDSTSLFWVRSLILIGLVYFGYQTVVSVQRLAAKAGRERLADSLFGAVMGGFNGYLIVGSIWHYMNAANYPFSIITAPVPGTPIGDAAIRILAFLPPHLLGSPAIYFAVAIAFVFVLVVFI